MKVKLLTPTAKAPYKKSAEDVGWDLFTDRIEVVSNSKEAPIEKIVLHFITFRAKIFLNK